MTVPVCPVCRATLDAASGVDAHSPPDPGDLTLCAYCRTWLRFLPDMQLRRASPEDLEDIDPRIRAAAEAAVDAFDAKRRTH